VPDDVWEFPRVCGNFSERRKWIPCQHPEALIERILKMSCRPGDTVIDMFAGSGVVNRVAWRLGLDCYGIDLSRSYCEHIARETGAALIEHPSAAGMKPENSGTTSDRWLKAVDQPPEGQGGNG
jgi:site-specific DNA-methyltransferase (adenine-specific)